MDRRSWAWSAFGSAVVAFLALAAITARRRFRKPGSAGQGADGRVAASRETSPGTAHAGTANLRTGHRIGGRVGYDEIARRAGISEQTAARRLERVRTSGLVVFRAAAPARRPRISPSPVLLGAIVGVTG